ncbi:alpha/beta-hydrolase [Meredithblackwellia eburnea MCA 4105]
METVQLETEHGLQEIAYSVTPSASAHPPLVHLHGLTSNALVFAPMCETLSHQRRTTIHFDWPGFGKSPPPAEKHVGTGRVESYVKLLRAFLLHLNLDDDRPVVLIGHGEGAFLVWLLFYFSALLLVPVG